MNSPGPTTRFLRRLQGPLATAGAVAAFLVSPACYLPHASAQQRGLLRDRPDAQAELETDRDAFTPATSTVGLANTVVESSYSYIDNRTAPDTNSVPELLVRWGISQRVELRLGWNYEAGGGGDVISSDQSAQGVDTNRFTHESRMLYGLKAAVSEQRGWTPRSCIILEGFTPTAGEATATQFIGTYALGWEMPNRCRLESSIRYSTGNDKLDSSNRWGPSVVLRMPIDDRWNTHVEYFGVFTQGLADESSPAYVSPGTHYLITPNLELGLRLGWGVTHDAANFFTNFGFAWRF